MGRFDRLLHPRTIACIGGRFAAESSRRIGYDGVIWPVHPGKDSVEGLPVFRHLDDLPGVPNAAFVAVNRNLSIGMVRQLAAMGAGAAVCYASGFREVGDGDDRQAALVEAAGDMPSLGPNCYGLINYLDGALLWPDIHGGRRCQRGVAVLTQSGNIAINLTMNASGLPVAYVCAMGNQAQTGIAHLLPAIIEDPRVTAIGLLLEGVGDVAARQALAANRPVVALKFGRSAVGAAIALGHTASLAGGGRAMDALFARWGIAQVRSIPAFLETLKLLHAFGPLPGADIATLSCSGGEAAILADSGAGRNVHFRPFTAARTAAVNPLVTVSNPFDYHTFIWGDRPRMTRTFTEVMRSGFDVTALVLDFPKPASVHAHSGEHPARCDTAVQAVAATERLGFPVVVKLLSAVVAHKSDVGGAALNLTDAAAVHAAATRILRLAATHGGRLLVERMVTDAVAELIVGIDRDPVVGPVLAVGAGGVLVDLLDDSAVLTLPTDPATVRRALDDLRCAPLFHGYRGKPPADMDVTVSAVMAIAAFATTNADRLLALDVNPLLLRPPRMGVVAADGLVKLSHTTGVNH